MDTYAHRGYDCLLLFLFVIGPTTTFGLAARALFQETNFTLEGKITEKAANKLTISTTDNIIFHVQFNDKTEIKRADGSAGTPADLKVGQKVSVAGDLTESGEIIAQKIEIEAPKQAGAGDKPGLGRQPPESLNSRPFFSSRARR